MPPAEIGHLGALRRASSTEDPFPELLKEESSLLREMNDAIAALSKQLKPQAPGAPPVPADGSAHPQDDAEPQAGLEAATAFGTTTEDLQETLLGHISHKVFGGDLKEGAVTAQPGAPDVTQPGASAGAGAQQLGAEQGESPEEAWRTLFLQGKGTGVKELVLKAAEHPEGAPGERVEAGELMEMEGVGEMQEKTSWEKARLLGEAEEVALRQGENPEAGLGSPEAGEAGLAAGWQLGPALEECAQPRSTGLGEEAEETSGCSEELERKPGEQLEREAPSWGQVWMGAAQGDGALPEVTVDPDPGMLEEECVRVEVQPWGETLDAKVPPAQQEERGRAGAEEGEVEVTQPLEAEPQGESAMGDVAWGENVGAEGLLPVAVPPPDVQGGGTGTDVQQLEAQSGDANVQLLAEADVAQQPWSEPGCPGTEQGGKVVPGVQPLEEVNKAELGLGEELGAAAVQGEGPSPTERPAGGAGRSGLLPVKAQALEQMGTEESRAHKQLREDPSPEAPQGGGGHAALQLGDEGEDEGRGQGEHELPNEPLVELNGAEFGQGLGTGAEEQPGSETDEFSTGRKDPAPLPVVLFRGQRPGVEEGGDVHHPEEELELVQGEGIDKDGLFLVKAQALEVVEAEDSWGDAQLPGGVSPETPQGGEGPASTELRGEAEDGAQRRGEWELPCELHPQGAGVGQGEGAGVQPWEEAVIPDTLEDQSSDANMQLLAEAVELELTPGGSMEEDVQPLSEAGYLGREQGWSVAPEVQLVDQGDKPELVELVEAEDLHVDTQLCEGLSPETLQGEERGVALELMEEAEDGAQGQDKRGLPQEPGLHPHGVAIGPGEGAPEGLQPREEAESLDTLEDQSTDAKVQLLAEVAELKVTPGWGAEADLQPLGETGSLDTEQAGHVAPDVQLQGQVHKPETVKLVEAEDSWVDTHLHGAASPEILHGWGDHAAVHLMEEAGGQEQGQGECELPQEPVFDPQGAGARQGEGAGARVQSQEEAGILDTPEDPSSDADMQPLSEVYEPETAPGGGTKADLGTLGEADFMNTEQGGAVAPDVQPLDQINEPELVEMEADNSWVDTQPCGGLSQETPQAAEGPAALELVEEAEDGVQRQGEHELPQEPVLGLQGTRAWQGDGAGAGVQPWEEAGILERLEDKRPDRTTQPLTEVEELTSTLGGSTEADLTILDAAGLQEGDQSQAPGPEAGLCAAPTTDTLEGAAGARVTSPAEATSYPECAVAPQGPGFEAKLGALTGPDGHILGDTQTQELQLEERAAADRRPLDGAPSLEVVQGEKPEAGMKTLWGTRGLGLKQGHDAAASALAPLVPEVPLQTSTLKLETMMQEDVLVPDVRRPGPSGQAAQSELQEQGSAQADKVRVGIASQQPEEKPPHVMETEQVPARPAEPPKQEVPPASTLHPEVEWEEGAGNDQLGMVLGDSSLWDAANSSIQLQRQLLGEQSKDLSAAQQEKKQEVGRKTSQKGEPSPGAASADGAGAAPRGSPEASLEPDHLYNVLFVGDSHVGKTSFLYRLHVDTFNPHLTATVGLDYQIKNLVVDNERFALRLWDSAGQERYHSITKQFFRKADGVVLMYDITSEYSFADVRYWLSCIQEGAEDGVVILLLGNKTDCAAERQVPTKEGERLAKEHQLMFYECSAASGHNVSESMVSLIRLLKVHEDELKKKAEEAPKPSQKKKGCCW